MVEISLEANSDTKTGSCDDNKYNELQLSSVNVHRGLLSSPVHTNHDKNNECMESKMTFNSNERKDQLAPDDAIAEAENQPCPPMTLEDEALFEPEKRKCTPDQRPKGRAAKRRRRAPWRSDQIRRQRNAKGRLSRSEMPYEELLKLREKERIAQQQRRERLRQSEAKNFEVYKDRLKKSCQIKPEETIKKCADLKAKNDAEKYGQNKLFEQKERSDSAVTKNEETHTSTVKSFVNPLTDSVTKPLTDSVTDSVIIGAKDDVLIDTKKNTITPIRNKKISFMLALGLAISNESGRDDLSTYSNDEKLFQSDAMYRENVEKLPRDSQQIPEVQENKRLREESLPFSADQNKVENRLSCEESVRSYDHDNYMSVDQMDVAQLDAVNGKTDARYADWYHMKRTGRNSLSFGELDNIRAHENMAMRRQRSRGMKDSLAISESSSEEQFEDASSLGDKRRESDHGISTNEPEITSSDEQMHRKFGADDKGKDEELICDINGKNPTSRRPSEDDYTGKKFINRFCNRSMLNADELESLRKREREYQRKRRARLREQKLKESQQLFAKMEPACKKVASEDDATEEVSRKPETRRSNGISCPSQKILESSESLNLEKESKNPSEVLSFKEENDDNLKNSVPDDSHWNGGESVDHDIGNSMDQNTGNLTSLATKDSEIVCRNSWRCDLQDRDYYSVKSMAHVDTEKYFHTKERSPFFEALCASDYKRKDSNGFFSSSTEPRFEYRTNVSSRIEAALKYEWQQNNHTKAISAMANSLYFKDKYHFEKSLENHLDLEKIIAGRESPKSRPTGFSRNEQTESQKWQHWKSGLSDDQLQRRRISNREAQRRRRLRLKMMQMSSSGCKDIKMEEVTYRRSTKIEHSTKNYNAMKAFNLPKTKLENILEKRQRVFLDAQMEKSNRKEEPVTAPSKSRGCRIKVTPQRLVVVPSMSYMNEMEDNDNRMGYSMKDCDHSDGSVASPVQSFSELSSIPNQDKCNEIIAASVQDETVLSSSGRKRKQFCPRRLLTDTEKRNNESMQRLAIAQF